MIFTDGRDNKIKSYSQDTLEALKLTVENLEAALTTLSDTVDNNKVLEQEDKALLNTKITGVENSIDPKIASCLENAQTLVGDLKRELNNTIITDTLKVNNSLTSPKATITEATITTLETITETLNNLEVITATINNATITKAEITEANVDSLNMTTFNIEELKSEKAELKNLTSELATLTRIITTSIDPGDNWKEPIGEPDNTELLKLTLPKYNGLINIVSNSGLFNITIENNTLVEFNQKELYIYRVEFIGEQEVNIYFNYMTPYQIIYIGSKDITESSSEIVDRTNYEQNINTNTGTVSGTEITYGDNILLSVVVVEELPETLSKDTIYVVKNIGSYYSDGITAETMDPLFLKTNFETTDPLTASLEVIDNKKTITLNTSYATVDDFDLSFVRV